MVNLDDQFSGHCLVINSAARSNTGIEKYSMMLRETLGELHLELVTVWMINSQRDSIELLRGFLNAFPDALIHVCRNLYFGTPEKFELYNGSKARQHIEKRGWTLNFPDLGNRVADRLYCERLPVSMVLSQLPIGDRAELWRWKNTYAGMFRTALGE